MSSNSSDFRFLVEPPRDAPWRGEANGFLEVVVPRGLSVVTGGGSVAPELTRVSSLAHAGGPVFETARRAGRELLLLYTAPGRTTRVNGRPAPRICRLEVRDQVQSGDALIHVTRFRHVEAAAPTPEQIGVRCPVCRVAIDEATRVVVHDCGTALHLEPESVPEAERMECALLGCPTCRQPVELTHGLVYEPEPLP